MAHRPSGGGGKLVVLKAKKDDALRSYLEAAANEPTVISLIYSGGFFGLRYLFSGRRQKLMKISLKAVDTLFNFGFSVLL